MAGYEISLGTNGAEIGVCAGGGALVGVAGRGAVGSPSGAGVEVTSQTLIIGEAETRTGAGAQNHPLLQ